MKNREWKNVFGAAPAEFLDQVNEALDRLEEEKEMKRRYKVSTVLIAAVLAVLTAGAALAAGMGLIDRVNEWGRYKLPEQAEELLTQNLGSIECEAYDAVVEEAIFDGQSVFLQILIAPKDSTGYALYDMEESMPEELEANFIFEEGAEEEGRPIPVACADGRKPLLYDVVANQVRGSEMGLNGLQRMTGQYNEDGSVRVLMWGTAEKPIQRESIHMVVSFRWGIAGEYEQPKTYGLGHRFLPNYEDLKIEIDNGAERTKMRLEAVGEGADGLVQFVGGTIEYTEIGGYYDVEYIYLGEEDWLNRLEWEAGGRLLAFEVCGMDRGDNTLDGRKTIHEYGLVERPDELPETMELILMNRMYTGEQCRIEIRLIPEE